VEAQDLLESWFCVLPGVNLTVTSWAAADDARVARTRSGLLPLTTEGLAAIGCVTWRRLHLLRFWELLTERVL